MPPCAAARRPTPDLNAARSPSPPARPTTRLTRFGRRNARRYATRWTGCRVGRAPAPTPSTTRRFSPALRESSAAETPAIPAAAPVPDPATARRNRGNSPHGRGRHPPRPTAVGRRRRVASAAIAAGLRPPPSRPAGPARRAVPDRPPPAAADRARSDTTPSTPSRRVVCRSSCDNTGGDTCPHSSPPQPAAERQGLHYNAPAAPRRDAVHRGETTCVKKPHLRARVKYDKILPPRPPTGEVGLAFPQRPWQEPRSTR